MNLWQVINQIRYLLLSRTWGGTGSRVFPSGSVFRTKAIPATARSAARLPIALVYDNGGDSDPEHGELPDLIMANLSVSICSPAIPGDAVGEKAYVGGNVPDRTKSEGRGLKEFEQEVKGAIFRLGPDTGVQIATWFAGEAVPELDPELGYVYWQEFKFNAWVTADRYYHRCENFVATGGSGSVSLSWSLPPDRYDRYRVVLRRASGSTAPTSISSGTGVTLGGNLSTSVTDTVSAGTHSYALFATYHENSDAPDGALPSADAEVSDSITRTSVSVT